MVESVFFGASHAGAASFFEASARDRIAGLLDPASFVEFVNPSARQSSPHLGSFGLPAAFDDGMIVGRGALDGRRVLIAAQEGRFMGGSCGEAHGAKLTGLLRAARSQAAATAVLILFDTGGVRLQEANAGEVAIAEAMRAILDLRSTGIPVIGLIGGQAGCFGGGGLLAACCSRLIASDQARLGVTGPEVIESAQGVEELDSADRALVWRLVGGRHRRLIGGVDDLVADRVAAFRTAAIKCMDTAVPPLDVDLLEREHHRLRHRLERFGAARDGVEIWAALGVAMPGEIPDMADEAFADLVATLPGVHDVAR